MTEFDAQPRKSLPAWGLSVVFHTLVVVFIGLIWRAAPRGPSDEPDRPAGIVLASSNAEKIEYFDQYDEASRQAQGAEAAQQTLPTSTALSELPPADVALPEAISGFGADRDVLMPDLDLKSGGGRWSLPELAGSGEQGEPAVRPRTGPMGPTAAVSLFGGSVTVGNKFVFLIDRSKSMGGTGLGALAAAQEQLASALENLTPSQSFQIIAYHQRCVFMGGDRRLLPATDKNKQAVQEFFKGLAAFGGTEHFIGLQTALNLRPDVLFLLTDGADPYLNTSQLREIKRQAGARTSIHCIQFGFGPLQDRDPFMRRLSSDNRGAYQYVQMSP